MLLENRKLTVTFQRQHIGGFVYYVFIEVK